MQTKTDRGRTDGQLRTRIGRSDRPEENLFHDETFHFRDATPPYRSDVRNGFATSTLIRLRRWTARNQRMSTPDREPGTPVQGECGLDNLNQIPEREKNWITIPGGEFVATGTHRSPERKTKSTREN